MLREPLPGSIYAINPPLHSPLRFSCVCELAASKSLTTQVYLTMPQCYEFNYTSNQPQVLSNVWIPCPVGDNCCIGIDTCLSNNICRAYSPSKNKREASYSSYYNARCTDPTFTDPACDKICSEFHIPSYLSPCLRFFILGLH
jgi:hypothetical protein